MEKRFAHDSQKIILNLEHSWLTFSLDLPKIAAQIASCNHELILNFNDAERKHASDGWNSF